LKYILKKRGGQGDAPPGLLPPLGERGVILQAAADKKRIEIKEDFNRVVFLKQLFNLINNS
jgi:hypothetical protein